jgi:FkbM family methyltransferase
MPHALGVATLVGDHLRRIGVASAGFQWLGSRWIPIWSIYAVSPVMRRVGFKSAIRFPGLTARMADSDLYTFANLFADYDVRLLDRALERVTCVIDAGANVGAFSWLTLMRAAALGRRVRIKAVEPNPVTFDALSAQPFANELECIRAAVGPVTGTGRLIPGSSAAATVVSFNEGRGAEISVIALDDLVDGPSLLKLDIEGGESAVLRRGLPGQVKAMFLETHERGQRSCDPRGYVRGGRWTPLSRDIFGSTTWFWMRDDE